MSPVLIQIINDDKFIGFNEWLAAAGAANHWQTYDTDLQELIRSTLKEKTLQLLAYFVNRSADKGVLSFSLLTLALNES